MGQFWFTKRMGPILGICLFMVIAGALQGHEISVAVLPPQRYTRPAAGYEPALLQLLSEWAQRHSSVRLLDPKRCDLIVAWLRSGAFSLLDADFFDAFVAVQPVDAWLDLVPDDGGVLLRVCTTGSTETLHVDAKHMTALVPTARECCAFVEKSLNLPADTAMTALLATFISDAEALAYCSAPLTTARWPGNSGEAQLILLTPFWSVQWTGPALASRILEAAEVQLSSTRRSQDYTPRALALAKAALPRVLGTAWEPSAVALIKASPESFPGELITLANKVAEDELLLIPDLMAGDALPKLAAVTAPMGDPLGAVRLLGCLKSRKSLELLLTLTQAATPAVRVAVAQALLERVEPDAVQALEAMLTDTDPTVAFLARLAAWRRAPATGAPVAEARAMLARGMFLQAVAEVLTATDGGAVDVGSLRTLAASGDAVARQRALAELLAVSPDDSVLWNACLADPDPVVIRQTLFVLPSSIVDALQPRLMALCDDPQTALCDAARAAVQSFRPTDPVAAARFDLATEHPWVRRRVVASLGAVNTPAARAVLQEACSNRNARTRAAALVTLLACDPEAGCSAATAALADTHRHVRLQAAALVAKHARAADMGTIRTAAEGEDDTAVRTYLELALATLNGNETGAVPAARSVSDRAALTWMCGMGTDAATSPYGAYYCLGVDVDDRWRAAHAAGKICFGRVSTVAQPGLAVLDPAWEDRSWLAVERALPLKNLDVIDGVVYGEETMNFDADSLWESGWRLFCLEAGLTPATIVGKLDALTPNQRRAWARWAAERHIDGFNQLYDDTKLRWGILRPGLQVATFMTEQCLLGSGPNPADLRWKFDVGGIYDYKGSNRSAYYLIRRIKTLWPERPIIWLSLGIGGYEMNPVKYTLATPTMPLRSRADRAYADSMSAWLAGADVGWFSTWIFVSYDFKGGMANLSGVQILLEDIALGNPFLERGVEFAFRETEKLYEPKPLAPPQPTGFDAPTPTASAIMATLDAEANAKAEREIRERVVAEKGKMKDGFLFYRHYIDTAARIFGELPRRQWRSPFLGVKTGLSVWSRATVWGDAAGLNILSECDFLSDLNKLPEVGIARYRTIVVDHETAFTDATISAITAWLRDAPNLLVVQGWLATDDKAGAPSVVNLEGLLTVDWPWETDITAQPVAKPIVAQAIHLEGVAPLTVEQGAVATYYRGTGIEPLWRHGDEIVAALWRKQGFGGAVIFDGMRRCSDDYLSALRTRVNGLAAEGIGLLLPDTAFVQLGAEGTVRAGATAPIDVAHAAPLPGTDWLSGTVAPTLGPNRSAAVVSGDFSGQYVVAHAGVVVVSQTPLVVSARSADGMTVAASGLLNIAGGPLLLLADGKPLPEQKLNAAWLFHATSDGFAPQVWKEDEREQVRYFVRSASPIRITRQPWTKNL